MKKTVPAKEGKSLQILLIFLGIVGMVIMLAFTVKIAAIMTKSTFDGKHRYTVLVHSSPLQILSFAPDNKTISLLQIPSSQNPSRVYVVSRLHLPIDGEISQKDVPIALDSIDIKGAVDGYMQYVLLSYPKQDTTLTIVDVFRLWLFTKGVEVHNVFTASLPESLQQVETAVADKTVASFFLDETMNNENETVQVINATGISGVGNDFAQILTNIGGNVISVTTAHADAPKTSIVYGGASSYTLTKLEKILGVKATHSKKPTMFGIIITIGKDKISLLEQ